MTQTPNFQLNQWSGDDYVRRTDFNADNAKIDAALAAAGNCRIVTGSYTGTGESGEYHPNTITFEGKPLLVFIVGDRSCYAMRGCDNADVCCGSTGSTVSLTWGENTLSWYSDSVYTQMNISKKVYRYIALMDMAE